MNNQEVYKNIIYFFNFNNFKCIYLIVFGFYFKISYNDDYLVNSIILKFLLCKFKN